MVAGGPYDAAALELDLGSHTFSGTRSLPNTYDAAFGVLASDSRNLYMSVYNSNSVRQIDTRYSQLRSSANSGGAGPAHLAVSPDGRELAVANYGSGHVTIFNLNADGSINRQTNNYRPEGEKAHWMGWHKQSGYLYTVILEAGKIFGFRPNGNGEYSQPFLALDLGTQVNPRHMDFHPALPKAYVLNERAGTLAWARINNDGTMTMEGSLSTLPDGFNNQNQTAHIQVAKNGRTLYTSNRGHDSIAVFHLDDNGVPQRIQIISSEGQIPRTFKLFDDQGLLIAANQQSSDLALFSVLPDGRLEFTGVKTYVEKPTFIDGTVELRLGDTSN